MSKTIILILSTWTMVIATSCGKPKSETSQQQQPEAQAEESAKEYIVDIKSTILEWKGSKNAGSHHGTIQLLSGMISTEKNVIVAGSFTVDMKTIVYKDLTDPKENKKLVDDLSSDNFFDVKRFSTSSFRITEATQLNEPDAQGYNYSIKGNLTIKDVTRNITIPAQVKITPTELSATSRFSISRKEFKLKYAKGKIFRGIGDSIIHDTIEFTLDLKASAKK
jgi:polyisoprenoid-binding protein YceI